MPPDPAGPPPDPLTDPSFAAGGRVEPAGDGGYDLSFHGDQELMPGFVDLAVNVRSFTPPPWLRARLTEELDELGLYPNDAPARTRAAIRHARPGREILLTNGAAEAFTLLARVLAPRRAVVVHPSFTTPEAALLAAGRPVERLVLPPPFTFDPRLVPDDADMIVLGNPTNPTSVLHPPEVIASLCRRGRIVVVDEAFADAVPGEPASLSSRRDLPGLVVVRSLTKTWGLAGLRVGYLLAAPALVARLRALQPPWPVSSMAIAAMDACLSDTALAEATAGSALLALERERCAYEFGAAGAEVVPGARAPFLLVRVPDGRRVRQALLREGFVVRRGETFPGLGPNWLRIGIRDRATMKPFGQALAKVLADVRRSVPQDGGDPAEVGGAGRPG